MSANFLINAASGFLVNSVAIVGGGKLNEALDDPYLGLSGREMNIRGQFAGSTVVCVATAMFTDLSSGFAAGTVASNALFGALSSRRYTPSKLLPYVDLNSVSQNSPEAIESGAIAAASAVATTSFVLLVPKALFLTKIIAHMLTICGCEIFVGPKAIRRRKSSNYW